MDFAPTLLSLCGLKRPSEMQGTDLSPVLLGKTNEGPQSVFFQIFGPFEAGGVKAGWRGVRTERYMYARYQSEPWVLFDLEKDPYELKNLAKDSAAIAVRKEMEKKLTAWMKETGDSWKNDWTFPVEDKGRLYSHRNLLHGGGLPCLGKAASRAGPKMSRDAVSNRLRFDDGDCGLHSHYCRNEQVPHLILILDE